MCSSAPSLVFSRTSPWTWAHRYWFAGSTNRSVSGTPGFRRRPQARLVAGFSQISSPRRSYQIGFTWLYPVIGVLALLAVGGATEAVIAATEPAVPLEGGELMVDVGGHTLFISCIGDGSPTVVLEAGAGAGAASFARIVPDVAATIRVCVYDRAGRGRSEPSSGTPDGPAIARDLHALLAASGNPGPYVLAGHSSGGVYARFFADAFPDEVAGMVLLDAQTPHAVPSLSGGESVQSPSTLWGIVPSLGRVGITRLVTSVGADGAVGFADEYARLAGILDAASRLPDLADRPLVVVTAASEPLDGWLVDQDHLATLSTNVSHRIFPDLTHLSLVDSASRRDGRERRRPRRCDVGPVRDDLGCEVVKLRHYP